MARDPKGRKRSLEVVVLLGDDSSQGERPDVTAYAYRQDGRFIGSTDVSGGRGIIELPPGVNPDEARVYVGPPTAGTDAPARDKLRTAGAVLTKVSDGAHRVEVDAAIWRPWLLCRCLVRGRVIKRQTRPDGTVVELPVCHTRVHIYDVDRWWLILQKLPDIHLYRIRDELLGIVRSAKVPPRPHPGPDPGPELPPALRAMAGAVGRIGPMADVGHRAPLPRTAEAVIADAPEVQRLDLGVIETAGLSRAVEATELRRQLLELGPKIAWLLCSWPWLEPFYRYSLDEIAVVDTDDDGYFSTTISYPCFGDHPDLYFQVEQERNGIWNWVYRPWVRCNTWWNYACGTFVTLGVTDPTARTCDQGVPIDPPPGLGTTWVMPLAIGGLYVRGYAGADAPDGGWVRTDGLAEDGLPASDPWHGVPFGFSIAVRLAYEVDIPTPAVTYYRLSWRAAGSGTWHPLVQPVYRYYEKHVPGQLFPSFPAAQMGPDSVGGQASLFRFRPHVPPGPAAADPPGTTTNWPAENFFGDIYHGYLDTVGEIPAPIGESASHGDYELGMELFTDAGVPVPFGPASVVSIFPDHIDPDLTIVARLAAAADFDGPACVFPLKVDNRPCNAAIGAPTTSGNTADECGMLHGAGGDVGMDFTAWREGGYATFGLNVTRGLGYSTLASTSGRVTDLSTPSGDPLRPWTGNGSGHFVDAFPPVDLLDTCDEAAFAVNLGVYAKVTTGFGRPDDYDAPATIAFAVVE
jgi:hypothetical protein